jgi:hypothetical protein
MKLSFLTLPILACVASSYAVATTTETTLSGLGISKDGRALELRRSTGAKIQRIDILAKCGVPFIGAPRISGFKRDEGLVNVIYGKHCFASVAIKDLAVKCIGCD